MTNKKIEIWDLWYPKGGPTGIPFARGRLDETDVLLVHGCPEYITVEVRDDSGKMLAKGIDLKRIQPGPITKLTKKGKEIVLVDIWPKEKDLELPFIMPGGEVGILKKWWNAFDKSEWRWTAEFYNHI